MICSCLPIRKEVFGWSSKAGLCKFHVILFAYCHEQVSVVLGFLMGVAF